VELYQAYADYNGMMDLAEQVIRECAQRVCGGTLVGRPPPALLVVRARRADAGRPPAPAKEGGARWAPPLLPPPAAAAKRCRA
jgi:hypothetical protein